MNTPICDFVKTYTAGNPVRLHMPGHKGRTIFGPESADITEIEGADVLYRAQGIIRESEKNAASLFETSRTLYSAEGASLCIRAMLYLALLTGRSRRLLAGRNAHRTLMTAAALLDIEIDWMMPGANLLSCVVTPETLEKICMLTGDGALPTMVPTNTWSPFFTQGSQGAPTCWPMGRMTLGGSGRDSVG